MNQELLNTTCQMIRLGLVTDEIVYALRSYGVDDPQALIKSAIEELAVLDQAASVLKAVRENRK